MHSYCQGSQKFKECTVQSWNTLFSCHLGGNGSQRLSGLWTRSLLLLKQRLEKGKARDCPDVSFSHTITSTTVSMASKGFQWGFHEEGRISESLGWGSRGDGVQREALPTLGCVLGEQSTGRGALRFFVQQLPRNTDPAQRNSLHLTPVSGQE